MRFVMVNDVPKGQEAPQQQQLPEQWDQHQKQSEATHTHFINKCLLVECSQHSVIFLTIYSLWTPVWGGSPDPAQSPALTQIPTRALVSLFVLFAFPFFLFFLFCDYTTCAVLIGNSTTEACAEFRVKYVGAIEKLEFNMSKSLQEPLDLISYIDAAQVRSWREDLHLYRKYAVNNLLRFAARWKAAFCAWR